MEACGREGGGLHVSTNVRKVNKASSVGRGRQICSTLFRSRDWVSILEIQTAKRQVKLEFRDPNVQSDELCLIAKVLQSSVLHTTMYDLLSCSQILVLFYSYILS